MEHHTTAGVMDPAACPLPSTNSLVSAMTAAWEVMAAMHELRGGNRGETVGPAGVCTSRTARVDSEVWHRLC